MVTAFGSWLKQRRKDLGISREEFAEGVGCSVSLLSKLESGERQPSSQLARLLADYLRIPRDEREAFIAFARGHATALPRRQSDPFSPVSNNELITSSTSAPWRSAYSHFTNLPSTLMPLVGRAQELAALREEITNHRTRLLTLTGAPGIGKTRLALQVAFGVVDHFEDGVFFVELAAVSDPDLVLPTVARTLGLKDTGDKPVEDALLDYTRSRKMLLLLDNLEQVLDAAPHVVRLMEGSPWLKVLVTSREALHVRGERRLPLPPLKLPDPVLYLSGGHLARDQVQQLERVPSIELFVEDARAVLPDFELTKENAADVAAICAQLEGLPLSIELAAARIEHLTPGQILAGLASRLALLTGGARDLPARHRTLLSAIEWSYELLNEAEQVLFRSLGIFAGGFTVDAAEEVCSEISADRRQQNRPAPLAGNLDSLVDKNLVRREEREKERGHESRYSILETIREYALGQLRRSAEMEHVRQRHALYFLALCEQAESELYGPRQAVWLERLEAEHDNLRAALDWAAGYPPGDGEEGLQVGLRISGALWRFWELHGYDREGRHWLESFIAAARELRVAQQITLNAPYAKALIGAGTLAYKLGDIVPARAMLEESLNIYRTLDDKLGLAASLRSLAQLYRFSGEIASAQALLEESLFVSRQAGGKTDIAASLYLLGVVALDEGDLDRAQSLLEESLALRREEGDVAFLSKTLMWLGEVARSRGDLKTAQEAYEEALSSGTVAGNDLAYLLHNLGHVAHNMGDHHRAEELFSESLTMLAKAEDKEGTIACLAGLAATAAHQAQAERAGKLFGATDALLASLRVHMDVADRLAYERNLENARLRLEGERWEAGWAQGRVMSLEEAVAYATSQSH